MRLARARIALGWGMDWRAETAVVVPCLNEASSIKAVVARARREVPKIIVVDDGSSDQTALLASEAGAEVLRQPITHGKGAALRLGWRRARELGYRWAFCLDGDGQHSPEEIPAFFDCASRGSAALVVGNRMSNPVGMPYLRRWVNRWMSRRLSELVGQTIPDSQCGFRLMDLESWSSLRLTTNHFEIESELLVAFALAGFPILFVPVHTAYKHEQSKVHPLVDTLRWLCWYRRSRRAAERP
jgi:glycosyltransferase involved in cell wall biosynthesis